MDIERQISLLKRWETNLRQEKVIDGIKMRQGSGYNWLGHLSDAAIGIGIRAAWSLSAQGFILIGNRWVSPCLPTPEILELAGVTEASCNTHDIVEPGQQRNCTRHTIDLCFGSLLISSTQSLDKKLEHIKLIVASLIKKREGQA